MKIKNSHWFYRYISSIKKKNKQTSISNSELEPVFRKTVTISLFWIWTNDLIFISRYKIKVPYSALDAHEIPNTLEKGRYAKGSEKRGNLRVGPNCFLCKSKARVWRALLNIVALLYWIFLKIALWFFFIFAYCLFFTPTFFFSQSLANFFFKFNCIKVNKNRNNPQSYRNIYTLITCY